jgi:sensor histidine kinase regulating citrate/malate metabolism
MKNLIGIYDSRIKTGNDTLDIILTERSLYCEKEGIRLSCIADGEKLGFMTTGDICSLFGNAVENAIEAVSKLDNPEDRIISFQVREKSGMLVITVDNYYSGTLRVENGLPKSTKGDDDNHGFGMKSIRLVAEKYGGEVSVTVDDMFHLSVIIPLPTKI